jgi:hypothetical protein
MEKIPCIFLSILLGKLPTTILNGVKYEKARNSAHHAVPDFFLILGG